MKQYLKLGDDILETVDSDILISSGKMRRVTVKGLTLMKLTYGRFLHSV